jgi:hypothetical protein
MIRTILGFALFAVVALLVLKIAFALLGIAIGLAVTVFVFAAAGYACYVVLRVFSPRAAAAVREAIRRRSASFPAAPPP